MAIFKIPQVDRTSVFSTFSAKALNQELTDGEIIKKVAGSYYSDREWNSAIKIGDIWLSIPCKFLSVYHPTQKKWDLWDTWAEKDQEFLAQMNIPKVTRDPMEKFIFHSSSYQNNITNSERVGALTNLVVNNNKPGDKTLTLIFECKNISIQNNIRPLFAQFLLAPFLPVHNMDLNMLVQPHDDSPEAFLGYGVAHIDEDGIFRFGSREQVKDSGLDVRAEMIRAGIESTVVDTIVRQQSGHDEYLRLIAYWKVPFYVQLLDFNFENMEETEASFRLTLNLALISPSPAYGGLPQYIINETSTIKQFELQKAMERAKKGDNSLMEKMVKMFNLGVLSGDESLKNLSGNMFSNYNLFDRAAKNELIPTSVTDKLEWAIAISSKDKIINRPYTSKGNITRPFIDIEDKSKTEAQNTEIEIEYTSPTDKTLFKVTNSISQNIVNETIPYGNMRDVRIDINQTEVNKFKLNTKQEEDKKYKETITKEKFILLQYNLKNWYNDGNINKVANGYSERLRRYAYMFYQSKADIITLQELGKTDAGLQDLCTALNDKNINPEQILWKPIHFSNGDGIGVGMLTKLNIHQHKIHRAYDIIAGNREMVEFIGSTKNKNGDAIGIGEANRIILGTRPILEITLEKESGNLVSIFVVHYRSKLDEKNEVIRKIESWITIKAILELPEDRPYIIVGDFNYGMFEEKSADKTQNAYGLYTNRIELDKNTQKVTHKITDFEKKKDIKISDETFNDLLDFICCFDIGTMRAIANNGEILSEYTQYYANMVKRFNLSNLNLTIPANFKRLITYHYLGNIIKTTNGFSNESMQFTFNNYVIENTKDGITDSSKTRRAVIDHILFSYHFFEGKYLDIDYKDNSIYTGYDDGGIYLNNLANLSFEYIQDEFVREELANLSNKEMDPYRTYYAPLIAEAKKLKELDNLPAQMLLAANKFIDKTVGDYWTFNTIPKTDEGKAFKGTKYRVTNEKYKLGVKKFEDKSKLYQKDDEKLMGDHYPVQVAFTWKYNTLAKLTPKQLEIIQSKPLYFEGAIGDSLSAIEFFPSINLYGDKLKTFYDTNVLNEKKELLVIDYSKNTNVGTLIETIMDGPIAAGITIEKKQSINKIIVTGIFYSILNEGYICILQTEEDIAMFPLIGLNVSISEWIKDWTNQDKKNLLINTIIGSLKFAPNLLNHKEIKYNNNGEAIIDDYYRNTQTKGFIESHIGKKIEDREKSTYFISNNFPKDTECVRRIEKINEDQTNAPGFPKIEKTFYLDYFKFHDDYYKGVSPLDPSELSLNISHCQPFRNYYLPLLAEFRDAVIDFPWKYNFDIDIFEPFITDFSGHMQVDQRLVFSRKRIKKSGRSLLGIIETAIEILAKMVEGREEESNTNNAYRRRYFGQIGELLLYENYSIRVQKIIQEAFPQTMDKTREQIKLNQNPAWNNLLMVETLMYIGVQMNRVLVLLDKTLSDGGKIQGVLKNKPRFTTNYKDIKREEFESEMDYVAFAAFNTTLPKLKNEREKVERYLNLNYEMSKNKRFASENTDSFDYSDGTPLKIGELVTLFRAVKEKILDEIFKISRSDAKSSDGNFALETI